MPPRPAWRRIYQRAILAAPKGEKPLAAVLARQSQRRHWSAAFVQKASQAMLQAVVDALQRYQTRPADFQLQLCVYVSAGLPARACECTWGFFKIEKTTPASPVQQQPVMHTIEFYLYRDD